ncbi:MAG: hypothetical protein RMK61_10020 [Bacteroidota bacterium]|nr:hypothetical protein [Bacteroidota bacterium]
MAKARLLVAVVCFGVGGFLKFVHAQDREVASQGPIWTLPGAPLLWFAAPQASWGLRLGGWSGWRAQAGGGLRGVYPRWTEALFWSRAEGGWVLFALHPNLRGVWERPSVRPESRPAQRFEYAHWAWAAYATGASFWQAAVGFRLEAQRMRQLYYERDPASPLIERSREQAYPALRPLLGLTASAGLGLRLGGPLWGYLESWDLAALYSDSLAPSGWPQALLRARPRVLGRFVYRLPSWEAELAGSTHAYLALGARHSWRDLVLEGAAFAPVAGSARTGGGMLGLAWQGPSARLAVRLFLPWARGRPSRTSFSAAELEGNWTWNRYSPARLEVRLGLDWRPSEPLAGIAGTQWRSTQLYMAQRERYALEPWGEVWVQNRTERPIEVRVRVQLPGALQEPFWSDWIRLGPRELRAVPVRLVLDPAVERLAEPRIADALVELFAERRRRPDDRVQDRFTLYERSAWDGDIATLPYYVEPQDSVLLAQVRALLQAHQAELDTLAAYRRPLFLVRTFVEALRLRIRYLADPALGYADRVQRPAETLRSGFGDCEDLAVLLASMLASVGVRTAFVDVLEPDTLSVPPRYGRPLLDRNAGHVYLLVDTGLRPAFGELVSPNRRRWIVHSSGADSQPSVWIPLEVTLIPQGFEAAWQRGAERAWLELGNGLDQPPRARIFDAN